MDQLKSVRTITNKPRDSIFSMVGSTVTVLMTSAVTRNSSPQLQTSSDKDFHASIGIRLFLQIVPESPESRIDMADMDRSCRPEPPSMASRRRAGGAAGA